MAAVGKISLLPRGTPALHPFSALRLFPSLGMVALLAACAGSSEAPQSPNPDTTPPTVAVASPAPGATVSGTITVSATASDNVGVAGVQFKVDGADIGAEDTSAPYSVSLNTASLSNAQHTLTAVARDTANNTTTSSGVAVTVSNTPDTTPPTVSITAPASGATVSGTITVSATASDNVGVAGVQFKVDGGNIGAEDTSAPYSVSLNTTSLSNAQHTLTAVARDAANNTTTSAGVTITVNNQAGSSSATFTLQPSQTKQTWLAWWGTLTGPNHGPSQSDSIPATVMNQMLDTAVNDLGLTGGRIPVHHKWAQNGAGYESVNDNADPFNIDTGVFYQQFRSTYSNSTALFDPVRTYNEVVLPMRNRVAANGESFTTYVSIFADETEYEPYWIPNNPACDNNGEEEFAEFIEAYVQWVNNDFSYFPTYISVKNEPPSEFFDDCTAPKTNQLGEMAKAAGNRLAGRGWPTKLIWDENIRPDNTSLKFDTCANDAGCVGSIGLASFHSYDYNSAEMPSAAGFNDRHTRRDRAAAIGVPIAMTEICCKPGWDGSYFHGLALARDIFWNMTETDIAVWMQLAWENPCGSAGCASGSAYISVQPGTLDAFYKLPVYWAIRQYMKWIRPGYVRVDTTCSGGGCNSDPTTGMRVKTVAFKRPNGSYVAVVLNDQSVSATVTLSGFPAGTYSIDGVDPTVCIDPPSGAGIQNRCTPSSYPSQTIGTGGNLVLTIPARGIVTFH